MINNTLTKTDRWESKIWAFPCHYRCFHTWKNPEVRQSSAEILQLILSFVATLSWTVKKAEGRRIDAFELWCWRRLLRVLVLQGDPTSPSYRRSSLGFHWKDWCWGWNSNTLATSCKELTYWKRPWCWEGLGAGGKGDDRGWDGWMASPTGWTWVWVNSGNWWWTGGLVCCDSWGWKEEDTTERLSCTELGT